MNKKNIFLGIFSICIFLSFISFGYVYIYAPDVLDLKDEVEIDEVRKPVKTNIPKITEAKVTEFILLKSETEITLEEYDEKLDELFENWKVIDSVEYDHTFRSAVDGTGPTYTNDCIVNLSRNMSQCVRKSLDSWGSFDNFERVTTILDKDVFYGSEKFKVDDLRIRGDNDPSGKHYTPSLFLKNIEEYVEFVVKGYYPDEYKADHDVFVKTLPSKNNEGLEYNELIVYFDVKVQDISDSLIQNNLILKVNADDPPPPPSKLTITYDTDNRIRRIRVDYKPDGDKKWIFQDYVFPEYNKVYNISVPVE